MSLVPDASLKADLFNLKAAMRQEEERHNQVMQVLKLRRKELQLLCPHINTRYSPDPSGGHDSYYVCLDCDKEF